MKKHCPAYNSDNDEFVVFRCRQTEPREEMGHCDSRGVPDLPVPWRLKSVIIILNLLDQALEVGTEMLKKRADALDVVYSGGGLAGRLPCL